jgi:hypothetical protein
VDAGVTHCCASAPVGYVQGNVAWGKDVNNITNSICCNTNYSTISPAAVKYCCNTPGNVYTLETPCCANTSFTFDKSGNRRCCAAGVNAQPSNSVWAVDSNNIANSVCCANDTATANNGTYYCCNTTGNVYTAENPCCTSTNVNNFEK